MLRAAFIFAISEALLAEYRAVLVRPGLRKLHGLTVAEIEVVLTELVRHAIVLTHAQSRPAPDPGDRLLWDLLATRADLALVTGDKLLLQDVAMRGRVISAEESRASNSNIANYKELPWPFIMHRRAS